MHLLFYFANIAEHSPDKVCIVQCDDGLLHRSHQYGELRMCVRRSRPRLPIMRLASTVTNDKTPQTTVYIAGADTTPLDEMNLLPKSESTGPRPPKMPIPRL